MQDDYLIRTLVAPLAAILATLLFHKKNHQIAESLDTLDKASRSVLGLDRALLSRLTESYLMTLLEGDTEYGAFRYMIAATLIKEEADVRLLEGNEEAGVTLYQKSLRMYLTLTLDHALKLPDEYRTRIEEFMVRLRGFVLADELRERLFRFFEQTHQYALAEDMLFERLDATPNRPELIRQGITFYERLLTLHPARLVAGKLPLEEVQEGLNELHLRAETIRS
jgi:hypothetical protein